MIRRVLAFMTGSLLLMPLVLLIVLSWARHWSWPGLLPTQWQTWQWRELLAHSGSLGAIVVRSLELSVLVAILATTLGFPSSRSVARHPRQGPLLALLHVPFAVSQVVLGVSLLYLFLRLNLAGHLIGVLLAQLTFAYAYSVILLSEFWNTRVLMLEELAIALGATRRQVWARVLLPAARPLLSVCLLQTFLISWFDYALISLIGAGRITTLTVSLYQYFSAGDIRLAATCALLLLVPPLLALGVLRAGVESLDD